MFKGEYRSDLSDEVIADESDVIEITVKDFSSKQSRTFHVTQDEYKELLEESDIASSLFLGDD